MMTGSQTVGNVWTVARTWEGMAYGGGPALGKLFDLTVDGEGNAGLLAR